MPTVSNIKLNIVQILSYAISAGFLLFENRKSLATKLSPVHSNVCSKSSCGEILQ
jgi:hypothetical protein